MARMTTAELRGYQQICDDTGAVLVVACDQRGGMRELLAPDREARARIGNDALGRTKMDIADVLARHAACVLVDPVCALPALIEEGALGRATALLIGLDDSGWDVSPEGWRRSKLVRGVDARRVRALGGTGGKIMVWLRPDAPGADDHNLALLKRAIDDFAAEDLLLVVEFLTWRLEGEPAEDYAAAQPVLVEAGVRRCRDLGAKLLKLPYPGSAAACAAVTAAAGEAPWAVLSAGVDHATFLGQVETAMANGAAGVIAGRALWKDCVSLDRAEQRRRLAEIAVPRLREIGAVIARGRPAATRVA
jgi:tagatose 1,6-diphosphate aldolase